jgi:hypothetical protein
MVPPVRARAGAAGVWQNTGGFSQKAARTIRNPGAALMVAVYRQAAPSFLSAW